MSLTVNDLSADQREAYNSIVQWSRAPGGRDTLTLGGYAGSGKSTLVSLVAKQIDLPAFCAYTGKATSVLRRKLTKAGMAVSGVQKKSRNGEVSSDPRPYCGTIHSLIYRPCDCREPKLIERPCPTCDAEVSTVYNTCSNGHSVEAAVLATLKPKHVRDGAKNPDGSCAFCGGKGWLKRETLDRSYGLIIVDEASMVDDTMLRDLRSYGVPILAVGDHGQLPPVGGVGSLMKAPNLRLEKIHRQAEGNPIIALSKIIRETGRFPEEFSGDVDAVTFGKLRFVEQLIEQRYESASAERLLEMGMACYTNRRRVGLNSMVRRVRGTSRDLPRNGEHVVCLRNMKAAEGRPPVANGMRGVLTSDVQYKDNFNRHGVKIGTSETQFTGSIAFPEDEIVAHTYEMLSAQFNREKTFASPEELQQETGLHSFSMAGALFDFGFAMTVHKMQGSAVDDLVVCAERPGPVSNEDWSRWCYTAATRAVSRLTVLR